MSLVVVACAPRAANLAWSMCQWSNGLLGSVHAACLQQVPKYIKKYLVAKEIFIHWSSNVVTPPTAPRCSSSLRLMALNPTVSTRTAPEAARAFPHSSTSIEPTPCLILLLPPPSTLEQIHPDSQLQTPTCWVSRQGFPDHQSMLQRPIWYSSLQGQPP